MALTKLFQEFVTKVLLHYFEEYYNKGKLAELLKVQKVKRKLCNKPTKFKTLFGDIWIPQIQVRVIYFDGTEHQMSITRLLLGVSAKYQIPDFMKELMACISSLTTYRVGHNVIRTLTNFKCSLMSVWRSVQWYANTIKFELSTEGTNEFEADGTGIPTKEGGKRGSELKVVFQKKKDGKLHLVGLAIGAYKEIDSWVSALSSSIEAGLKQFGEIVLASDGDQTIIEIVKSYKNTFIQMDIWHVFHQLKYYLWSDGVAKNHRYSIIAHFFKITMLSKSSIIKRNERIKRYIFLLESFGYTHSATYLSSSMKNFYTYETKGNTNMYTTKTERSMRTTNERIGSVVWSRIGALNIIKIRLGYYYNRISPFNWKNRA